MTIAGKMTTRPARPPQLPDSLRLPSKEVAPISNHFVDDLTSLPKDRWFFSSEVEGKVRLLQINKTENVFGAILQNELEPDVKLEKIFPQIFTPDFSLIISFYPFANPTLFAHWIDSLSPGGTVVLNIATRGVAINNQIPAMKQLSEELNRYANRQAVVLM